MEQCPFCDLDSGGNHDPNCSRPRTTYIFNGTELPEFEIKFIDVDQRQAEALERIANALEKIAEAFEDPAETAAGRIRKIKRTRHAMGEDYIHGTAKRGASGLR